MKLFSQKLNLISLLAMAIMAISIALLDVDDLSWVHNIKSYVGLIVIVLLLIIRYYVVRKSDN